MLINHSIESLTIKRNEAFLINLKNVEYSYEDYFEKYIKYYLKDKSQNEINEFKRKTEMVFNNWKEYFYTDPILVLYGTEIAEVRKHAFLICLGIILSRK